MGANNVITARTIRFRISEVAWNEKHSDSVTGYHVQVQKIDREGNTTNWYGYENKILSVTRTAFNEQTGQNHDVSIDLSSSSFYSNFLTSDGDGSGSDFLNGANLFNDSSQILLRIRPYIGKGDPVRNEVGSWSDPLILVDNTAPCDSDFVTGLYCNDLQKGGVQILENVSFNNATGLKTQDTGYVEVVFPEDMDPTGPAPTISFFYGPFGGVNPSAELRAIPQSSNKSRWINGRKYRIYISVPVFDYTCSDAVNEGAYYNISVAGCRDASGNSIQTYGTNGSVASDDILQNDRALQSTAKNAQIQGSNSVAKGFITCD